MEHEGAIPPVPRKTGTAQAAGPPTLPDPRRGVESRDSDGCSAQREIKGYLRLFCRVFSRLSEAVSYYCVCPLLSFRPLSSSRTPYCHWMGVRPSIDLHKKNHSHSRTMYSSRAPPVSLSVCLIFIISLEGRQRHREYCRSIDSLLSLSLSRLITGSSFF